MDKNSSRHHYIPKFLIKRFCNYNGKTFLYEKDKNGIREVSPKQIFFSWGRNTFDFQGTQIDNVERFYADIDNMFARVLTDIESKEAISSTEMMYLVFFANSLKWRVPASDNSFNEWKDKLSFENLGVGFEFKEDLTQEQLDKFEDNLHADISKEFKRMLIAMQPVRFQHVGREILKGLFLLKTRNIYSILGDNPVIELNPNTDEFIEDFIFPISELDTLVYKRGSFRKCVNENFYLLKDIAQLHLADNFAICKNLEYLRTIMAAYESLKKQGKLNTIIKGLFQTIDLE